MEVKITFEDIDLEVEVEQAVKREIQRLVGKEMANVFNDNKLNYQSIHEMCTVMVNRTVTNVVNERIAKIDAKINEALDKEIEGLAKAKVAKALSAYERLARGNK